MKSIYKSPQHEAMIMQSYNNLLRRWDTKYLEKDVVTRYGTTHVVEAGWDNLIPLVLFHGIVDDSALVWLHNAKAWAEKFHIYAIDTIAGPGKSRPNENYKKDYKDVLWIDDVLDQLGLVQVNLAGVSHGGFLAQIYKVNRPDRVNKVFSIAAAVPAGKNKNPVKTMLRIFLPEALFPSRRNVLRLMKKVSGDNYKVFTKNSDIIRHYTAVLKGFKITSLRFHNVYALNRGEIDTLRRDTLYILGEADPFEKLGGKASLLQYQMKARLYPRVGHGINHEIADEVNQIVISRLLKGKLQL